MLEARTFTATIEGKTYTIETGKLARLAGGAVTIREGDTVLLATATMSKKAREGIDFFPLTVDYEERMYAGGKIPGSFFRREGRPSEPATLMARLTDRPIRPLFPSDMRNDVQIVMYSLSADGETQLDMLGIVGASAALTISDIPFAGPVAAIRVARIDGAYVFNPTFSQMAESDLDLRLAGTRDAILMVECASDEVDEATMISAIEAGHAAMIPLIEVQDEMRAAVGKPKSEYITQAEDPDVDAALIAFLGDRLDAIVDTPHSKTDLYTAIDDLGDQAIEALTADGKFTKQIVSNAFHDLEKAKVRSRILGKGQRPDGRGLDEIRALYAEIDLMPRTHGSGLFTRGETQVLTLATLGTPRERQEMDGLSPINEKRYIHHYNFPAFSVGEAGRARSAGRREIGHGALAERALVPVLPPQEEFPYTMRLVSEVMSSNGSTSMASVCGSTLALMDAGVPITKPVAGIAMGLIKEDDNYKILTDIQGLEDHLGDMDFKVAGTRDGITALQMDIKIKGITPQIMAEALDSARSARFQILDTIEGCIKEPRADLKDFAPRMSVIKIDPEKIGAVIGPGGKMIRSIQEETGVSIDIQDDGSVFIAAVDGPSAEIARERIESLTEEAVIGRIYTGRVVRTTDFGAFVEILPNKDGMVHISQLDTERIEKVEDVARVGDEITVMVTDIDPQGKIRLSRQAVLEGWTPEEALEKDRRPKGRPGSGNRGSRSSSNKDRRH
ncbi:MAG: polyribonucleotide nucleotidyltransferase [Anaerolineales bacterium]|nr:polyribonucleotide nucleotidyltransferase [Anaerolineales bacterium]